MKFASVHDLYWTHACSIDQMSGVIRDSFVTLHSSHVLSNLYDEVGRITFSRVAFNSNGFLRFMKRYKGYRVPIASVKGGTLLKKLADRKQTI